MNRRERHGRAFAGCALALALLNLAAAAQTALADTTYFEFGKIVALGRGTVDVLTYDSARRRLVQHTYLLTKDTRADRFQAGDTVELIYAPASAGLLLRRLVLLPGGMPVAGPPPPAAARAGTGDTRLPAPGAASARDVTLPATAAKKPGPAEIEVNLGRAAGTRPAAAVNVPLGAGTEASVKTAQPRVIVHEAPSEECNRSALDWPQQPVSLAVLDFRYPTEREESHESGTTGGGSGTAVADLVFSRLEAEGGYALSRGDRQKLYRADFAGAARLGRQMGVDAVLAGTFVPIDGPPTADGYPGPRSWELRAGVVDTCTGQLLLRLYSQSCANGAAPGQEANDSQCKRLTVTAKQATNPEMNVAAFQAPLDAMLYPLEHNRTPAGEEQALGTVTRMEAGKVTLTLAPNAVLRPGEELAVHASRLTKNPLTYTLQNLHEQEIGRVSITSIQGSVAVGAFAGEIPPVSGDIAVRISPE